MYCNKQKLLDCFDNDLENNFQLAIEHNEIKLQEIPNRIIQT